MSRLIDQQTALTYNMPSFKCFNKINDKLAANIRMYMDLEDTDGINSCSKEISRILKAEVFNLTSEKHTAPFEYITGRGTNLLTLTCEFYLNLSPTMNPVVEVDNKKWDLQKNMVTYVNNKLPHTISNNNNTNIYLIRGNFEWVTAIHAD